MSGDDMLRAFQRAAVLVAYTALRAPRTRRRSNRRAAAKWSRYR